MNRLLLASRCLAASCAVVHEAAHSLIPLLPPISPPSASHHHTNSTSNAHPATRDSPSPHPPDAAHRRRPAASISPHLQPSHSTTNATSSVAGPFSHMLRRRRSAGALASNSTPQVPVVAMTRPAAGATNNNSNVATNNLSGSHRIRLVPHLDSRRSLRFEPISRDVKEGDSPLRIGRFTDRSGLGLAAANANGSNKLAFKSKVVSRAHAEIWVEAGGKFYIKDTKSSSGTFLNHVRLANANQESRPHELKDGDMLQLGVDYQGGTEDIYKCVKIKIEVNREWQAQSNPFNANALKQLKEIAAMSATGNTPKKVVGVKSALPDCCICLFAETINQALFIAPCSHTFHYKCIRPLLEQHHPNFACPLCRTFANLEDDVEVEVIEQPSLLLDTTPIVVTPASGGGEDNLRTAAPDPGAETEVENDNVGGPRTTRRRSFVPPVPANATTDVGEDAEMLDLSGLPVLPEHEQDPSDDGDSVEGDGMFPPMNSGGGAGAASALGSRSAECLYRVSRTVSLSCR
ncbi:hypothetical protein QCA50_004992 [Cerrena zonata]|uniref:SMAD/FHA domain-containing protein n=1 Tax=Cerrena zonata TaxID=2478898 RepID=A0AAW0GN10_9APHY